MYCILGSCINQNLPCDIYTPWNKRVYIEYRARGFAFIKNLMLPRLLILAVDWVKSERGEGGGAIINLFTFRRGKRHPTGLCKSN